MYGVALNDTVQFVPCDQISLLYPILYGVALSDSVFKPCSNYVDVVIELGHHFSVCF